MAKARPSTAPPSLMALVQYWLGTDRIPHLEALMATAQQQIKQLSTKVDGVSAVAADIHADYSALVAKLAEERENLTESGQAALDEANQKLDAAAARLSELDTAVGDHDSSDNPATPPASTDEAAVPQGQPAPGGVDGTVPPGEGDPSPEDAAPPAGEGTVFNPDEQFRGERVE